MEEEDDGEDGDITPVARDDDAFLGQHHDAFEVPDTEADGGETPDDCMAQVTESEGHTASPLLNKLVMTLMLDASRMINWRRLCTLRLCNRTPGLRQRWGNSIVMRVQEDP